MNDNQTAFTIIAKVNNLEHVKDNIYVDSKGIKYYQDKYGFHTTTQHGNHMLLQKAELVKSLYDYVKNIAYIDEIIGRKTRSAIRKVLTDDSIEYDNKLDNIASIVKKRTPMDENYVTEMKRLFDYYKI